MAIDEQDVFAGVADDPHTTEPVAGALPTEPRPEVSLDDLRHRLDTPLYAREPGLAAAAQVPGLRELTWDHVTNPTSTHPVVPGESIFDGEPGSSPRPAPLKLDDLLARPPVTLKPLEPFETNAGVPTSAEHAVVDSPADLPANAPADTTSAPPPPLAAPGPAGTPAEERAEARSSTTEAALAPAATPTNGRAALPSFADIVASSGSADGTPSGGSMRNDVISRADAAGVDSLLKPIDEPPPVARDTDPLVSGLAELILMSTPGAGMPSVAELREVSRHDTGSVPEVEPERSEPPVLDAKVEFAAVSTAVPVIPPPPPSFTPPTGVPASGSASDAAEVEAEMNRLAFLPDQDDAAGPVEVPEIAYSDVRGAEPVATPNLSLSAGEMYQPRASVSPVRHNYNDLLSGVVAVTPSARRRKRHHVRNIITLVVLLAMVAGGLFAVKTFVLDRVQWSKNLATMAAEVETARGLTFDHSIELETVPPSAFAARIVTVAGGYADATRTQDESQLRAFGLLNTSFDTTDIGLAAMADSPAFYDPTTDSIVVVDQLADGLRTFAIHRALTMALLDQHFKWSSRLTGASPAVQRGTRALYDGDALAVAQALLRDTKDEKLLDQLNKDLFAMYAQYSIPVTPSRFVSVVAGRFGLALEPYFRGLTPDERNLLETDAAVTDGQVLDLRRLVSGAPEDLQPNSMGMLFWYHSLAGRIDDDLAWKTALAWQNDEIVTTTKDGATCATGTVRFAAAQAAIVTTAFNGWLATAPSASKTIATVGAPSGDTVEVTVSACDPGETGTNDGQFALSLGGAPLRAEQFADAMATTPPPTDTVAACAVYGTDAVTVADERGIIDPVGGWKAPDAHKVDLAAPACAKG